MITKGKCIPSSSNKTQMNLEDTICLQVIQCLHDVALGGACGGQKGSLGPDANAPHDSNNLRQTSPLEGWAPSPLKPRMSGSLRHSHGPRHGQAGHKDHDDSQFLNQETEGSIADLWTAR